ncbi:zinc finger protein 816-like isoform X3 [Folsomia candida]|uniref:zinc finger protein 816-like isoform X3 n=1 Tax=Folsomia candida TaxID=158441 RepID=UPI001604D7CE|nr:zinc finger protein 816-like isoform X3 [Folsomia candida]
MDLQKKWECSKCRKTFKTKGTLKRHEITHGQAAKVKCEVCGKISKNSFSLASHMRKQHTNLQRPSCDTCHRVFSGATSLRCHTETSHSTKERSRFPCPFPGCEKTYPSQGGLWQHVKKEHGQNPVQFPCTLCGKEFKRRAELVQHIPTHTKEKPHNCAICGKSFARRTGLKSHEVTHLEKSTRDMLQCHVCPQTFITRQGLQRHVQIVHENQRNYPCTFSDKRFFNSSSLNDHVQAKHTSNIELIHSCDKCEYKSHSKVYLTKHRIRHNPASRECYFCVKKFCTFRELVSHCRVHTQEKFKYLFIIFPKFA